MKRDAPDSNLESLLEHLKRVRGFDFTGYKRPSLMRRVEKRMQEVGAQAFDDYRDYLEVHTDEFARLFDTILINVTGFFRDPQAWEYLNKEIIPQILAGKKPTDSVRVWSAGCATGEEAYTLAMLLAEHLGISGFRQRVKIYATDLDQDALAVARQGSYDAKTVQDIPEALLKKYFDRTGSRYSFHTDLRRSVIFGRNDQVQDAPISRLDLLVCRNTLMYFNAETQERMLSRFHFALQDKGFLFLGKAEMLLTHDNLFFPKDLKHRVFSKVSTNAGPNLVLGQPKADQAEAGSRPTRVERLGALAFERDQVAQLLVDATGILLLANERAKTMFGLRVGDIGRSFLEMELAYRPVELRGRIAQVVAEQHPLIVTGAERLLSNGETQYLDVNIMPIRDETGIAIGVNIAFNDVTSFHQLKIAQNRVMQELQTAYEELQSTNEELETTNEELQSTNEELETTNEELQSTNEEMETMNEELQSTNAEMQTVNTELSARTEELNKVNISLHSILGSLRVGVILVDRSLTVQEWNRQAEELWGLRADEARGEQLMDLDIGLPVQKLKGVIRACMSGESQSQEAVLDATNRRGKRISCQVTCSPLLGLEREIQGVIVVMEETEP
jgi:two-component system CheB/CheR fusion protein